MAADLEFFLWCVRQIPNKLEKLLLEVTGDNPLHLQRQLRTFYSELQPDDVLYFQTHSRLEPERLKELATKVGLRADDLELPLKLFHSFRSEQEALDTARRASVTDDYITHTLTLEGVVPLSCSFLINGLIYIWDPRSHLRALLIEDNRLASACQDFLIRRGASYSTIDEVREVAKREKWPNYQLLVEGHVSQ